MNTIIGRKPEYSNSKYTGSSKKETNNKLQNQAITPTKTQTRPAFGSIGDFIPMLGKSKPLTTQELIKTIKNLDLYFSEEGNKNVLEIGKSIIKPSANEKGAISIETPNNIYRLNNNETKIFSSNKQGGAFRKELEEGTLAYNSAMGKLNKILPKADKIARKGIPNEKLVKTLFSEGLMI